MVDKRDMELSRDIVIVCSKSGWLPGNKNEFERVGGFRACMCRRCNDSHRVERYDVSLLYCSILHALEGTVWT